MVRCSDCASCSPLALSNGVPSPALSPPEEIISVTRIILKTPPSREQAYSAILCLDCAECRTDHVDQETDPRFTLSFIQKLQV